MMAALYILLVLCVLMVVGVSVRTYLHIRQHRRKPEEPENIDHTLNTKDPKV